MSCQKNFVHHKQVTICKLIFNILQQPRLVIIVMPGSTIATAGIWKKMLILSMGYSTRISLGSGYLKYILLIYDSWYFNPRRMEFVPGFYSSSLPQEHSMSDTSEARRLGHTHLLVWQHARVGLLYTLVSVGHRSLLWLTNDTPWSDNTTLEQ